MHPVVYQEKGVSWVSLRNNSSEKEELCTTVSTFVLLAVGGNDTSFDPFLGSSSVPELHH
jgi:hypothetical protein